ncbi:heparan-alpha-glucosaminide N-acetyltransferase [Xylophilus sp. GOD-11R]|uniref:heparan-alpha-glucosaminide N-acetyltransferase n=1 Tax=Xylophilus sp. GOD-11R TaxID=3089814 RepID=UPI00298C9E78|nr:heparan-alpha-glucosaminide N-acetyltransferase [Xylophilus sp. GOD-11R]WPB59155.1 heparan-alpha-glucosaminide N-acetyltransferase [Xylophilus sp. GOD-11R]
MEDLRGRASRLDALRGLAVVWMTVFHFCFDLNFHGFIQQRMLSDPVWTWQRASIVTLFLFCAGMGQALALASGQGWPRFWRRWAQVAGCALAVTAGSYFMFPKTFIGFGVLHGLATMLIIARLSGRFGGWLWPMGAVALLSPLVAQALLPGTGLEAAFNGVPLRVLGLVTVKPFTEDYVPILPWLGVVWWGLAAGSWAARHRRAWLEGPLAGGAAARALAWLGRHSLPWYMLHQPVLMGLVGAAAYLARA